jgi:hypothetical protein
MGKLKMTICEAHLLLLYKKCEVGANLHFLSPKKNFTFFSEVELLKLKVFGRYL